MDIVAERIEGKYELCQIHISTCCNLLSNLWSEMDLTKVKKKKPVSDPISTFQY